MGKGSPALVSSFQCADTDLVAVFTVRKVVVLCPASKGGHAGNYSVAESYGARMQGFCADLGEDGDKLARKQAATRSSLAKLGA